MDAVDVYLAVYTVVRAGVDPTRFVTGATCSGSEQFAAAALASHDAAGKLEPKTRDEITQAVRSYRASAG